MNLLLVCFASEIPRNANVIQVISCEMVSPIFARKIYNTINHSHEYYNTMIVFVNANDWTNLQMTIYNIFWP